MAVIEGKKAKEVQEIEDEKQEFQEIDMRVLQKYALNTDNEQQVDKSKYTHLSDHHDEDKVSLLTEWQDKDEVYSANIIRFASDFGTRILGNSPSSKKLMQYLKLHVHQQEVHMTSFKRQSRKEDVYAVKGDSDNLPNFKQQFKQFGIR